MTGMGWPEEAPHLLSRCHAIRARHGQAGRPAWETSASCLSQYVTSYMAMVVGLNACTAGMTSHPAHLVLERGLGT